MGVPMLKLSRSLLSRVSSPRFPGVLGSRPFSEKVLSDYDVAWAKFIEAENPPATEVPVIRLTGEEVGSVKMYDEVFQVPLRRDILHRVVMWQRNKRRQGSASSKGRSEVRGGGRKPWKQKGTGRARQGTIRAPHWRGGGAAHGPKPRDHSTGLQKKVRALGLKVALSARMREGRLFVIENDVVDTHKTKPLLEKLEALQWTRPLIITDTVINRNLHFASRNIKGVRLLPWVGANVYDILLHHQLVITRSALDSLHQRFIKPSSRNPLFTIHEDDEATEQQAKL
mmetsp:Transcript_26792/g.61739  ORF Transcript_26792/g.61739 Transcript_26792/m.61739 type:complete len:284 (+) Transcript_26792:1-852(+)